MFLQCSIVVFARAIFHLCVCGGGGEEGRGKGGGGREGAGGPYFSLSRWMYYAPSTAT